jgi:hypothetical protein
MEDIMRKMIEDIFYKNGKVIEQRFKKSYLDKNKSIVDKILSFHPGLDLKEIVYLVMSDMSEPPKCKCCDKNAWFKQLSKGYGIYCSNWCQVHDPERQMLASKKRHEEGSYISGGIKAIKTRIERYGGFAGSNKKTRDTKTDRYGDQNYNNPQKMMDTNTARYGVRLPLQNPDTHNKALKNGLGRSKVVWYNDSIWYQGGNEKKFIIKNLDRIDDIKRGPRTTYHMGGIEYIYSADFLLDGVVYEVKSCWTWDNKGKNKELRVKNKLKLRSLKRMGFPVVLVLDYKEYSYKDVMTKRI